MFDRPIAFHREFARLLGSVASGVFLSQLVYWHHRTTDPDGWFYKSVDEWTDETMLSEDQQRRARAKLRDLGLLREEQRGFDRTNWYLLDYDRLEYVIRVQESNIKAASRPCLQNPTMEAGVTPPSKDGKFDLVQCSESTPETTIKGPLHASEAEDPGVLTLETPRKSNGQLVREVTDLYQNFYVLEFGEKPPWSKSGLETNLIKRQINRNGGGNAKLMAVMHQAWATSGFLRDSRKSFQSLMSDKVFDLLYGEYLEGMKKRRETDCVVADLPECEG